MEWATSDLDRFVLESDQLGGPGAPACEAFWVGFAVRQTRPVNQDLDPFSEAYVAEQMRLYEELAGKVYESHANEQTAIDVARHVAAPNPYDHPAPEILALHIQRLSRAFRFGRVVRGDVLLDMGCGWGLSSEIAAYLGLTVKAVDINPAFVQLVNERAARNSNTISATLSTFETFVLTDPVDVVLFYECLHHAVRPWVVIARVVANLKAGGRLILAGEPINDFWWRHWGMRLDAMSVYCIRKFGWFESGWSLPFIIEVLFKAGLVPEVSRDADPAINLTIIGKKGLARLSGPQAMDLFQGFGCIADRQDIIFVGKGGLDIRFPDRAIAATLHFVSFRHRNLGVQIETNGVKIFGDEMAPGSMELTVQRRKDIVEMRFNVELWIPDEELHNGDKRSIGMHLSHVVFNYD